MGTALAIIGTAAAIVVGALFRRGGQQQEDTRARATQEMKRTGSTARNQIDSTSEQYLKDVRENARRR
jgi:F0F1-type ATP synthase membrane subunit b/b'